MFCRLTNDDAEKDRKIKSRNEMNGAFRSNLSFGVGVSVRPVVFVCERVW